jgi:hypothetical protein
MINSGDIPDLWVLEDSDGEEPLIDLEDEEEPLLDLEDGVAEEDADDEEGLPELEEEDGVAEEDADEDGDEEDAGTGCSSGGGGAARP